VPIGQRVASLPGVPRASIGIGQTITKLPGAALESVQDGGESTGVVLRFNSAVMVFGIGPGAAHREALVVSNSAYESVPFLPNAVNDASDVSTSLKRLGFDVRTIFNAKYEDLRRALIEFTQRSIGAELAVILFRGARHSGFGRELAHPDRRRTRHVSSGRE
jgi:hypothetical protein